MTSRAQAPGSLPRPGPIGRAGRLLLGLVVGAVFVAVLVPRFDGPPGHTDPTPLFLVAVVVAFRLLPDIVDLGFRRRWGARTLGVAVAVTAVLTVTDLVAYGRWWAPPLAWYLFLLVELSLGVLAISFITASILAVPG